MDYRSEIKQTMASYNSAQADLNASKIKFVFRRVFELIEDKTKDEINIEITNAISYLIASTASIVLGRAVSSLKKNGAINDGEENTKEILEMSETLKAIMETCYWEMRAETYSVIRHFKYKVDE